MVIITKTRPGTGEVMTFHQDGYLNKMLLGFRKAIEKHNTSAVFVIDGRSGMGKCLTKGSKVLMGNGEWKNIEDIKMGEEVISPQRDGSFVKSKVTGTHNRFEEEIYDVYETSRDKKLLYSCAWNHDIPFFRTQSNRIGNGKRSYKQKLDIKEARELSKMKKDYATSFSTTAIDYGNKDSLIEPYCLGVFLGDGNFNKQLAITSADFEVMEYVSKHYEVKKKYEDKRSKAKQFRFSINGKFADELTRVELKGKGSATKFIPKECLLSSIDYRMKLLAGLIDTDGYVDKINTIVYTTKSKRLAKDIKYLVFSLGGHSKVREIWKSCQTFSEKRLYYCVKISFKNPTIIPLLLKRKIERLKKMKTDPRHIKISVVKGKPSKIYGIEIDSKSKWHVTDNWMVTHNTTLGNQLGITFDDDYGLKKIFYNPEDFLKALANTKKGDCVMFDEAMLISSRSALSSINKMIIQAMSMIRSKRIYVIFCVNSIFDLDKNLAISRADLLLHVYGDSLVKRGKFGAFFRGADGSDRIKQLYLFGKKFYEYGKPKANFIGRFPKEFVVDEREYERRKQKGVNLFLRGKIGGITQKAIASRNQMINRLHDEGWKVKKIMEYTGLSQDVIYNIVRKEVYVDESY